MAGGNSLTDIITAISQLVFTVIFLLMFLGVNQRIQVALWAREIRAKLGLLRNLAREARSVAVRTLREYGVSNPDALIDNVARYFMVQPVDIEPVDIIRRLERILRTREDTIRKWVVDALPAEKRDKSRVNNAETLVAIAGALETLYRVIRHLYLTGVRYNNWALVMQVNLLMPQLLRIARSYREAADVVAEERPIGDSAGPLAAYTLAKKLGARLVGEAAHDTVYYHAVYEGRDVYIVKAEGPGSTVGHPGEAVENIALSIGERLAAIVTIDAVLKLEGEESGEVALGAGVAMGDPGPEKIRIERLASRLKIPLHAIGIKMSIEEAITGMRREIVEAIPKAVEHAINIIRSVPLNRAVIIVGVGNTIGVGQ